MARKIKAAIPATFLAPSPDGKEAWLFSKTEVGHQPMFGQRLCGVQRRRGSGDGCEDAALLVRGYREKTAVREGCVRSVLSNDTANPNGWQKTVSCAGRLSETADIGERRLVGICGDAQTMIERPPRRWRVTILDSCENHHRPDG